MGDARGEVVIDDDQVRVTRWSFAGSGEATGAHVHEYDYVVVPVTGGSFTVLDVDGTTRNMTQESAHPYRGSAGTAHDVVNSSDAQAIFVEVELKHHSINRA
jgi:beta-alanine degradation protein BauB